MAKSRLHELAARGQSVWFDTLSRDLVQSGGLKKMMADDAITGVTSNPTIFQKALSQGDAYDEDLKKLLAETDDPAEIFFSLALQDIRDACDVLKPAYDKSNGLDGYVSMEVEPGIAYDTLKTFEQARWIASEVDRPNLYVKIPATVPGLPAIEDCTAHGTSINITLIFSLERYAAVVEARGREESWSRAEHKAKQWIATVNGQIDLGTADEKALAEPLKAYINARASHLIAIMDYNLAQSQLALASGWDAAAP